MKYSEQIKPISYLKANTAEVIKKLRETGQPLIITVNGEARVVMQDVKEYEETQNAIAMLKLLNLRSKDIEEGKGDTLENVMNRIRSKIEQYNGV